MRDLIWTIIIIWVVYKIIDLFRGISVKKTVIFNNYEYNSSNNKQNNSKKREGSVTVETPSNKNNKEGKIDAIDAEYVDFEEIK